MLFTNTFNNLKRAQEIVAILGKYGFEDVIANTSLINLVPKKRKASWQRKERPILEYSRWERIRMAFEELGPTFVKGAQVLSNRPDILPQELLDEFEKLQSNVPPFDIATVREIIEEETGQKLESIFAYFKEEPIGSASIGQVHFARLKDGTEVVVKVQRPRVQFVVETDIAIMKEVVKRGAKFFEQNGISNPMDVILAFEKSMQKELDYTTEARNIDQFRNFYKDRTDFYVPRAYKEFSTRKVLVLEFVKGCKVTDVTQLKAWGLDPEKLAVDGMNIYLTQIFEFGFFHADPHPGNIIIREDGTICLIDFGMVGKLMKRDKFAFAGVFIAMAQQNPRSMAINLQKLAIEDEIEDINALEQDLYEIIQEYSVLDVADSSMAELAQTLQNLIYRYKIRVPGGIFIILRALAILEGIGKTVYPQMNAFEAVKPFGTKLVLEQYSSANLQEEMLNRFINLTAFLDKVPVDLKDILSKVKRGKLHLELSPADWEPIVRNIGIFTNRLALSLLIGFSLALSGLAMIGGDHAGPLTDSGLPYISVFGLIFAGLLSFIVFFSIIRSGRY